MLDVLINFFVMVTNGLKKSLSGSSRYRMALHVLCTKTLKCSFYRHPCFLLCVKIYNPFCFLSFSMPCYPTLEINLWDEAVSNNFLRSRKNMPSLTLFLWWTMRGFQEGFFLYTAFLLKKKPKTKTKPLVTDLPYKYSSDGVDQDIFLWIWKLWRSSSPTSFLKAVSYSKLVQLCSNISMDGNSTVCLDNLFRCSTTITII